MKHIFKHLEHSRLSINDSFITEVLCLLDIVWKNKETRDVALPLKSFLSDTRSWGVEFTSFSINFFLGNYLTHEAVNLFLGCRGFLLLLFFNVVFFGFGLLFLRPARAKIGKAILGKGKGWREPTRG